MSQPVRALIYLLSRKGELPFAHPLLLSYSKAQEEMNFSLSLSQKAQEANPSLYWKKEVEHLEILMHPTTT